MNLLPKGDEMSNSKGTKERCGICKLRKRGSNHDEGSHHKAALAKLKAG